MGKKKGKGGSKSAAGAEATSPSTPAPEAETSPAITAEASDAPSLEPSTLEPALSVDTQNDVPQKESPVKVSSSSSEMEDLRKELEACKSQIAQLQAQNASLSEENQRLKSSQTAVAITQPPTVSAVPDFEALTQRIATLKAEQAEADAAREAAWSQLKSVVADIARLAAPDAIIKAGTPTASSTPAGFGAA
ncbi:hypothetical protein PLESTB_001379600 [Pleodorina starrii]|uniref:Uncharacterized protein n=1 Tax=Pleodorina starrii TaxID=330485 RepID=A0A9W6F7J5_9CHLO|nr:hypothetical protein PLESTM_000405600 [Pleodorina starrii]GLC58606.1 hypothetical protein PLESTB_001379600 [Pleodorina starrii]GLC67487.1 hypothetical protein PLESTF_000562800 [Pleodorina starrii]